MHWAIPCPVHHMVKKKTGNFYGHRHQNGQSHKKDVKDRAFNY